jgi:hypothetical protein
MCLVMKSMILKWFSLKNTPFIPIYNSLFEKTRVLRNSVLLLNWLTNYIDFSCLPLLMTLTHKKELNAIKKICKVNKGGLG